MAVELNSDLRVEQPKAVQADLAKKISPQLTEAIRKDILILTSKFGGMDPMEQLGDRTKGQDIETRAGAAVQDAAEIDWSRYLELCLANFEMETQPLQAQAVRIDWDFLLNWTPSDGKTLEENLADLAARYQSLWRVITENFSGAQQMELLARLDMVMMAKLNELFQSDLGRLYDFLAENGQREAAEAIRPSVQRAGFALAHGERPAAQRTETGGRGARMPAEESGRPIHGGRARKGARGRADPGAGSPGEARGGSGKKPPRISCSKRIAASPEFYHTPGTAGLRPPP